MSQALVTRDGVILGWVSTPVKWVEDPSKPTSRVSSKEPHDQIRFTHEGKVYVANRADRPGRLEYEIVNLPMATVIGWKVDEGSR